MLEIIGVFCTAIGVCQDVQLNLVEKETTPHQCMFNGQLEMAKWLKEHPGYTPKRLTCQRAGRYAKA
jgi:hypothetical protein